MGNQTQIVADELFPRRHVSRIAVSAKQLLLHISGKRLRKLLWRRGGQDRKRQSGKKRQQKREHIFFPLTADLSVFTVCADGADYVYLFFENAVWLFFSAAHAYFHHARTYYGQIYRKEVRV